MSAEPARSEIAHSPFAGLVIRLRFTILFLMVMVFANLAAGSLGQHLPAAMLKDWGIGHKSLLSGQVFRLITGTFLSHDPDMLLRQFIFAATVIGYIEWTQGTGRAALLFFGLDITGTFLLLACVGWGVGVIDMTSTNDVGMSIGGFGLIGVAITKWRYRWLLLAATLLAIAVKFSIEPDLLADGGHVLALTLGFFLASVLPLPKRVALREANNA